MMAAVRRFCSGNAHTLVFCIVTSVLLGIIATLCEIVFSSTIFKASMADASRSINGQSFFMVGAICAGALFMLCPKFFVRRQKLVLLIGLAAFIGLIALFYNMQAIPGGHVAAPIAFTVWSAFYNFAKLMMLYVLVESRNFSVLVGCIACSRMVVMGLVPLVISFGEGTQLVVLVAMLAACLALAVVFNWLASNLSCAEDDENANQKSYQLSYLIGQAVFVSIVVATLRALSPLGIYDGLLITDIPVYVYELVAMCVPLAAWSVFFRKRQRPERGYGTAFLIILSGLFVAVLMTRDVSFTTEQATTVLVFFLFNFGHVAYWNEVASISWLMPKQTIRVIGAATIVFSACVFLWIVAFQNIGKMALVLIIAAAYLCTFAIWKYFPFIISLKSGDGKASDRTQEAKLMALAERYGLSPREGEVFMLLAQGRSRKYIHEKLDISDGTVKTHVSRVYSKMNVRNKQEMLAVVFGDDGSETSKGANHNTDVVEEGFRR